MRETDDLIIQDYTEGKRLFDRETSGVYWFDLTSQTKQAWARRAREERRTPVYTYVVVGMGGSTERVKAATMHEALNKAVVIPSSVLSITRVP